MSKITGKESATPLLEQNFFNGDLLGTVTGGLTIRQHFAAMAMQGILANNVYHNPNEKHKMIKVSALAETSVTYADALIKELNKNA